MRRGGRGATRRGAARRCAPIVRTGRTTRRSGRCSTRSGAGSRWALDDDLNVSGALGALFEGVRELNRRIDARTLSTGDAERALACCGSSTRVGGGEDAVALEPELAVMLDARVTARAARDWAESDRFRDELAARGVLVEDTRDGQRWRRQTEASQWLTGSSRRRRSSEPETANPATPAAATATHRGAGRGHPAGGPGRGRPRAPAARSGGHGGGSGLRLSLHSGRHQSAVATTAADGLAVDHGGGRDPLVGDSTA